MMDGEINISEISTSSIFHWFHGNEENKMLFTQNGLKVKIYMLIIASELFTLCQ